MGRVGNGGTDAARSDFRASSYPAVPISTPQARSAVRSPPDSGGVLWINGDGGET